MPVFAADIIAQFKVPEDMGTNPQSLLLLLPLLAAIAIVYKATKVSKVTVGNFLKETILLFGSILVFMIVTGLVLIAVAWLVVG